MAAQEIESKNQKGVSGVAIPAGLLIGMGIGFLIDNLPAGTLLGLGVGFMGLIILRIKLGEW